MNSAPLPVCLISSPPRGAPTTPTGSGDSFATQPRFTASAAGKNPSISRVTTAGSLSIVATSGFKCQVKRFCQICEALWRVAARARVWLVWRVPGHLKSR